MTSRHCPVKKLFNTISEIPPGQISQSQCRQQIGRLLELLDDICNGRGKTDHMAIMIDMAGLLVKDGVDKVCADLGRVVSATLEKHRNIFFSHIEAHYCPTGECVTLSAAPCQLACPASVDVPSYVALVAASKFAGCSARQPDSARSRQV